jgi:hypothetical protein
VQVILVLMECVRCVIPTQDLNVMDHPVPLTLTVYPPPVTMASVHLVTHKDLPSYVMVLLVLLMFNALLELV